MADNFNICDQSLDYFDVQALAVGESNGPRHLIGSTAVSTGTQNLRLVYFTAKKTEVVSQVRVWSGGTAAGATPSLVRIGVWTTDSTGALLSLVASTANDTALFATQNTAYTKSFSASFTKQAGQRYATGVLVVTAAAAPTLMGLGVGAILAAEALTAPVIGALVSGQSDLPSTLAAGSLSSGTAQLHYAALLP